MELKAEWENLLRFVAMMISGEFRLPMYEWLPAIWLYIIGCPSSVRCVDDLIRVTCSCLLELRGKLNESEAVKALEELGFRPSLARWISYSISDIATFEQMLYEIAEPVSWNSFLCIGTDGALHQARLIANVNIAYDPPYDPTYNTIIQGSPSTMKAIDDTTNSLFSIVPVPFTVLDSDWHPRDFARHAFDFMQTELRREVGFCFYGHCCSEQSIIRMCKHGMSPFAGYRQKNTCGHGMYFFRMSKTDVSFDDLNSGTNEGESAGAEFRSFVYAMSAVFQRSDCHALAPAVLLFRVRMRHEQQQGEQERV
jgi:hypothetical protein